MNLALPVALLARFDRVGAVLTMDARAEAAASCARRCIVWKYICSESEIELGSDWTWDA